MPTYDIKPLFTPEIDTFLRELSDEAKKKLWKVVNALRLSQELSGSNEFPLPLDKIKRNKASDEDAREGLSNLHERKIIEVTYRLKVKYRPDEYVTKTIVELPDIFSYTGTRVRIDKDRFAYLEAKLRPIIHPELAIQNLNKIEDTIREENCIISSRALKLVAREIDSLEGLKSHSEMARFLQECGVSRDLYKGLLLLEDFKIDINDVYSAKNIRQTMRRPLPAPTESDYKKYSRAMFFYRILLFYSCTSVKDHVILFKILEGIVHPLFFEGDVVKAHEFQEKLNVYLIHAGFFLQDGKVYKAGGKTESKLPPLRALSPEVKQRIQGQVTVMKRIVARNEEREKIAEEVLKRIQKMPSVTLPLRNDKEKLRFYPETGDITLRDERGEVNQGSKGFALLTIMDGSKNTPFTLEEIKGEGNPLVNNHVHYFKKEKDVDDTIRLLKSKLKVGKRAYFPIEKKGVKEKKKWIWIEK
ncbi:MAG: hypothetical protein IPJ67_05125 [Candidatus Moraniibacteriota bacterium]|nr:MAG: hypothetical protein IPJ67_05125 [Candidatus Moranbacteria bacterium]